jgi:hypothetical protein
MNNNTLFRVLPTASKQTIGRSGNWGLYETVITLEEAATEEENERYLTLLSPELLPPPQDEYISLEDAHRLTGLRVSELIRLCETSTIKAKKEKGKWFIHSASLENYIRSK